MSIEGYVPPGRGVRVAGWLAAGGMLVYAGLKVYMALRGEIGMPGSPAPPEVQARFEHPALAQAGNAALGVGAAAVAWAAVARWGARIPRWLLLGALALAVVMQLAGAVVTVARGGPGMSLSDWAMSGVQLAAWCVVTVSYAARTRGPARVRPWAAYAAYGAYGAFGCALAYGLMKLNWALGGAFLARETPLPPTLREDLLARTDGMVAGHWLSVALAVLGMAAALHLAGHFGPHGRLRRRVLLVGAWAGCAFMAARAVGLLGYGFAGDLLVFSGRASVPAEYATFAREQAWWDLLLWSPYWLLFGACWGVAARRYRRADGPGRAAVSHAGQAVGA
ncbi:DUF3995 domain-containing protein [Streptomyces sp. NBC_01351]|uniref:DUF3995 domain-containing protein n=1 Tax=Streptomyces sp. NBC_01351 TaxID=2903833 RepID=UPI002E327B31|nr:DUF3995 domain-containing protein [Streptomyces sp. NBC_01351]